MSPERLEALKKHAAVMAPVLRLFNEKWVPVTPAVECAGHPQHDIWCNVHKHMSVISDVLLEMITQGEI